MLHRVAAVFIVPLIVLLAPAVTAQPEFRNKPDFRAVLVQLEPGNVRTEGFSGVAYFWLNDERTHLKYQLRVFGMDLIGFTGINNPPDNDVTKIHLHEGSVFGPHVLNIYKAPSQDDDDLTIFAGKQMLQGIWDDSDETVHSVHPEHNSTLKLTEQLENLCNDRMWVVVHGDSDVVENPGTYGDRVIVGRVVGASDAIACNP